MTRRHRRQRQDSNKVLDLPVPRHKRGTSKDDHHDDTSQAEREAALKALKNLGHLAEEVGVLSFLARTAPLHVNGEHMSKQCLRDVQRETTEENGEHENPFDVEEKRVDKAHGADAVAHKGKGEIAQAVEDDDDGEPDFPTVERVS